jgi:DUF1365 family protein
MKSATSAESKGGANGSDLVRRLRARRNVLPTCSVDITACGNVAARTPTLDAGLPLQHYPLKNAAIVVNDVQPVMSCVVEMRARWRRLRLLFKHAHDSIPVKLSYAV